ncbi:MAG: pkn1B [Myxococcales bacterium]|nr:pkn1B [Myxococcales bacterium]
MTDVVDTASADALVAGESVRRLALAAPSAPRLGEREGPYRLVKLLGAGAVGCVFEVEHEKLGRRAALKLLAPELGRRPAARARFFEEALAVNSIHSRHIVEVTDVVETEDRQALVMELLEGQTLGAAMAAGALPPERFLPILADVCVGLAAAHAAGFVHRDLKPDNIFLCARGARGDFVKLLDFGLATTFGARAAADERPSGVRRVKAFVGTPAYVSPEQASGETVDHTTDIYAVGVILYELVTGRVPFAGGTLEQYLVAHASAPVPRLPAALVGTELGRTLDAIVQRCMAKDPAARFASASELAATFAALGRGELPVVSSLTGPRRRTPFPRRVVAAVVVALAALAALVAVVTTRARPPEPNVVRAAPHAAGPASLATVVFESEPSGAEVRLVATGELLGVTPFRRTFARPVPSPVVEIERVGFLVARATVPSSEGGTVRVVLARAKKAKAPGRAHRRLDVEKTFDPFHFRR